MPRENLYAKFTRNYVFFTITVLFRPGVQSLVAINFELNTTCVLSRVIGPIDSAIQKGYQRHHDNTGFI
jgi:hypothetical protein